MRYLWLSTFVISLPAMATVDYSTSCPNPAYKNKISLESSVELRPALIQGAAAERDRFIERSIEQQLKFFQKSLAYKLREAGIADSVSGAKPTLTILKSEAMKSSADYEMSPVVHPDVSLETAYLQNALKRGHLRAGEEIVRVHYRASWEGISCGDAKQILLKARPLAPFDPWLAFWIAPASSRFTFRWQESEFTIAPLFDPEFADIPHPEYAWYFWRPHGSFQDARGQLHVAMDYLKQDVNVTAAKVTLLESTSLPALRLHPPKRGKELRITQIFGIADPNRKHLPMEEIFQPRQGNAQRWDREVYPRLDTFFAEPNIDRGSRQASDYLRNLSTFLNMSRFSYSYDPKQFVLTIRGRFAESNQPLRLRFFFGPSDLLVRLPPKHWRVAGEGLANDDLVFYVGHAGLGENFRPENIASLGKRDLRRQRYDQLLGIFSCYSYTYNSQDWHKREVFLTGGSYGSSRSSLGILRYYDRVFASGRAPASIDYTEPGDFLILQSRR